MKRVLDATAIRSGIPVSGEGWLTTPGVLREIELGRQAMDLELLLDTSLVVMSPDEEALETVRKAAAGTGDLDVLSGTDLELLALALQQDAVLWTDDYAIQNVAQSLGIEWRGVLPGIRDRVKWHFRCTGCGRYYAEMSPDCRVCGSPLKRVRRSSEPVRD